MYTAITVNSDTWHLTFLGGSWTEMLSFMFSSGAKLKNNKVFDLFETIDMENDAVHNRFHRIM